MSLKRTPASVALRAPAADNVAGLKRSIKASGLGDKAVGWLFKPDRLLKEFEGHLAFAANGFKQTRATATPKQLADMDRWEKKITDILQTIRLIRSARAEGELDIAQSLYYVLGTAMASSGFAKATIDEEPTYSDMLVDDLHATLVEESAKWQETVAILVAKIRGRTIPATNSAVAMKPLRQEYIERIDCELGARKGKKKTRSEEIQSLIRTRIQATPVKGRLPYMKKPPGLGLIQKYIK